MLDYFSFRCITVKKIGLSGRSFINAVNSNGSTNLLIYSRHTIDTMNLIEAKGFIKNRNKNYYIIKNYTVLDRFMNIRNSYSKLNTAMLFLDITDKSHSAYGILYKSLIMLGESEHSYLSIIYFLSDFLIQNGVFNDTQYSTFELTLIKFLIERKNLKLNNIVIETDNIKSVIAKLVYAAEFYLGRSIKLNKYLNI